MQELYGFRKYKFSTSEIGFILNQHTQLVVIDINYKLLHKGLAIGLSRIIGPEMAVESNLPLKYIRVIHSTINPLV